MDEDDYEIGTYFLVSEIYRHVKLSIDTKKYPTISTAEINPGNSKQALDECIAALDEVLAHPSNVNDSVLEDWRRLRFLAEQRRLNCSSLIADIYEFEQRMVTFGLNTAMRLSKNRINRNGALIFLSENSALAVAALELSIIDGDHLHISNSVKSLEEILAKLTKLLEGTDESMDEILAMRDTLDGLYISTALSAAS